MVTIARAQRPTLPLATVVAVAGGVLIAVILLLMPTTLFQSLLTGSGISVVIAATGPSPGVRVAIGSVLGGGFYVVARLALSPMIGGRELDLSRAGTLLHRGDVHPDAPPRPPLFATRDLGTPFLDVKAPAAPSRDIDPLGMTPAERPLPRDLDQPMAAFDPGALLAEPLPPAEALASLSQPAAPRPALIDPGDRFETFELTPATRSAPVSIRVADDNAPPVAEYSVPAFVPELVVAPETEATVHDLLARLEHRIAGRPGARDREPAATASRQIAAGSLTDTLGNLRRLATAYP